VRRMPNICIKRGTVFELHYAAKCVALSSGRNVRSYISLKKSRYLPLEGSDLSRGPILLRFRCARLPLERKYVKDASCSLFSRSHFGQAGRDQCCHRGRNAAIPD
jgi:hypothetical protein